MTTLVTNMGLWAPRGPGVDDMGCCGQLFKLCLQASEDPTIFKHELPRPFLTSHLSLEVGGSKAGGWDAEAILRAPGW